MFCFGSSQDEFPSLGLVLNLWPSRNGTEAWVAHGWKCGFQGVRLCWFCWFFRTCLLFCVVPSCYSIVSVSGFIEGDQRGSMHSCSSIALWIFWRLETVDSIDAKRSKRKGKHWPTDHFWDIGRSIRSIFATVPSVPFLITEASWVGWTTSDSNWSITVWRNSSRRSWRQMSQWTLHE